MYVLLFGLARPKRYVHTFFLEVKFLLREELGRCYMGELALAAILAASFYWLSVKLHK